MKVLKRNGKLEDFDVEKILTAVKKAYDEKGARVTEEVRVELKYLETVFSEADVLSINNIQDSVEKILMDFAPYDVAKEYILYRERHKESRFIRERLDYMDKYSSSSDNAASSSETDDNANITQKNVATLETEVYKATNRIIQRQRMKDKLNEMFPEVAKQYEEDINKHIIYIHDEASTPVLKNYCMAVSLYPLVDKGSSTLDGLKTTPPTNLNSFCGQLTNVIFLLSSQCKGAVGVGEFFNFFDYYCVKEWGEIYHLKDSVIVDSDYCVNKRTLGQKIEQYFQQIVYTINQPQNNRGQSPFVNFCYFDSYYWNSLFDDFYFPDGTKPSWDRVNYLQKKFMKWFNKERTKTLLTFPVESVCMLHDGKDIIDKEYKDFIAEMYAEGHSFFTYLSDNPDAIASCCRLRNEVTENTFSSTTGLTGVQTGSCSVITLNLNRIIQDWMYSLKVKKVTTGATDKEEYIIVPYNDELYNVSRAQWCKDSTEFKEDLKKYLINILERVHKYHVAFKTMLYEIEESGMLSASKAGYIDISKLYSTIGVNGFNEAAEFLGFTVNNNDDYKNFIAMLFGIIKDFNTKHSTKKFRLNLEVVPAESLGVKNYNWDKEDGYKVPEDRNLYNSYIYNAHDDTSVLDKFILQGGNIAKACSGGQAVHCNLEEHLSKEQYLKLIDHAIKVGTNYFTFNIPNSECKHCSFITKVPIKECPKCHSDKIVQYTRIIGYLRPITSFSKDRQIEANKRIYSSNKI